MAERNETDIVFDDFQKEDFIYVNRRRKGDPDYIIFHIARTAVGKNHIGDKNADIAKRLDEKIKRTANIQTTPVGEGDIFAHVYQAEENTVKVEMGEGQELWNKFKKKIKGKKQIEVLERCKLIGMKNQRFLINCNDEDFELMTKLGIMQKAQEFFNCVGSYAPVIYRG